MKSLIAFFLTARPARPLFAEQVNAERAMQIAELKWLLAEIAAPGQSGDSAWQV
jgi:hypothetical protein